MSQNFQVASYDMKSNIQIAGLLSRLFYGTISNKKHRLLPGLNLGKMAATGQLQKLTH
jgi:hypothetical protein